MGNNNNNNISYEVSYDYSHKQINVLKPTTVTAITSDQLNDHSHDLGFDLIVNQLRDLMPDQTDDLSRDQLLDLLSTTAPATTI